MIQINPASSKNERLLLIAVMAGIIPIVASGQQAAPASQPGDNTALREIVVTGTKWDRTILDTPASVAAFTPAQIKEAEIIKAQDFLNMVSNVTFFDDDAGQAQVGIRGQGAARGADQSVALVIDGVSLTSTQLFDNNLFDIKQLEVFKGPQSTIYGRNASAGAVIITTPLPTNEFEGAGSIGYSSWNTQSIDSYVSGPISPELKFRLSVDALQTDGAFRDITTGDTVRAHRDQSARIVFQYDPTHELDVIFRVSASRSEGDGLSYNGQLPGLPIGGVAVSRLDANQTNLPFVSDIAGKGNRIIYDTNLTFNYDLHFASIVSITDYSYLSALNYDGDLIPYIPNTPSPPGMPGTQSNWLENRSFSEDIRIRSSGAGPLRWMAGAYYLNLQSEEITVLGEDLDAIALPASDRLQRPGSISPTITYVDSDLPDTNYAVYANIQLDIVRSLELSVAARYDIEKKQDRELAPDEINPLTGVNYNLCVETLGLPLGECSKRETFRRFTPKASLTYKTDYGNLYASYGTGFKSGGYNPIGTRAATLAAVTAAGQPTNQIFLQDSYAPEVSKTYEVGAKGKFFDNHLTVNLSEFLTDVTNMQEFTYFPTAGIAAVQSIDRVRIIGTDADFSLSLPDDIRVMGSYGYNDGKIKAYSPDPAFVGNVSPLSFKYTIDLSLAKNFGFGDYVVTPRIEFQRQGPIYWGSGNYPGEERGPVDLMNASITFRAGKWDASVWGKNLLNTAYNSEVVPAANILQVLFRGDPRSIGANATLHF
jgi:iron complex outermembrane receptor protein